MRDVGGGILRVEEGDREVLELTLQAGEEIGFGRFRVVDLGCVAVGVEVAGGDEAVASCEKRGD